MNRTENLKAGPKSPERTSEKATLSDLGISKNQSSRWQKMARMDEEELSHDKTIPPSFEVRRIDI